MSDHLNGGYVPSKKQYNDMNADERAFVRMEAEEVAKRVISQHSGRPFLLKVAGQIIEAEGRRLEPQPEPANTTVFDQ